MSCMFFSEGLKWKLKGAKQGTVKVMPKKKLFWFNYIANSKFYTLHIYYIQI